MIFPMIACGHASIARSMKTRCIAQSSSTGVAPRRHSRGALGPPKVMHDKHSHAADVCHANSPKLTQLIDTVMSSGSSKTRFPSHLSQIQGIRDSGLVRPPASSVRTLKHCSILSTPSIAAPSRPRVLVKKCCPEKSAVCPSRLPS